MTVLVLYCFQIINIQAANQESAQADWNSHLDDFEKLMLLKALKEEKVHLLFRGKHSKVNICTYFMVLDEWEVCQVTQYTNFATRQMSEK